MTLAVNTAFKAQNDALSAQPIYVFKITFNGGLAGTDNLNEIYFGSDDISQIVNFPYPLRYFPMLDAASISGITQRVDPVNGVSSIGTLSANLIDHDRQVSAIIEAADRISNQGLRRQMCEMYQMFAGMEWADAIVRRTVFVDGLKLASTGNQYRFTASDAQKQLKTKIFEPATTFNTLDIAASGALTLSVIDAAKFNTVAQPYFGTAGFIQVDDEIMLWTSKSGNDLTIAASGRAQFGSTMVAHDAWTELSEVFVLRENPITMALKVMSSTGAGTNGIYDVLPANWGAAFERLNIAEWTAVAAEVSSLEQSTLDPLSGIQFEIVTTKKTEAKRFIETEICKIHGCFPRIKGDGSLGLVAYNDLANVDKTTIAAADTFTTDDVISWGDLDYNYKSVLSRIWLDYNEVPKLSGNYDRHQLFLDSDSVEKWGEGKELSYTSAGMIQQDVTSVYSRIQKVMERYSRPPLLLPLKLMPKHSLVEIGDIKRIQLPLYDLLSGADLDRAFEVLTVSDDTRTGSVLIEMIAQPEAGTLDFSAMTLPTIQDAAYKVGTQITTLGPAGGPHIIPDGNDFPAGDFWFDGDVRLPFGNTCTINGTVRLFSLGIVSIQGTVDGVGRGSLGGLGSAATPVLTWDGQFQWRVSAGQQGSDTGLSGQGGQGGAHYKTAPSFRFTNPAQGGAVLFPVPPAVVVVDADPLGSATPWPNFTGVPTILQGSGGGAGSAIDMQWDSLTELGGDGGDGGAGLAIIARGVFINSTGQVNLNGLDGVNGATLGSNPLFVGSQGGGTGGGGSLVVLAERSSNGIPSLTINSGNINVSAGALAGTSAGAHPDVGNPATVGTDGSIVAQNIG